MSDKPVTTHCFDLFRAMSQNKAVEVISLRYAADKLLAVVKYDDNQKYLVTIAPSMVTNSEDLDNG